MVKNPSANGGDIKTWIQSLGQEDPLEESMASYSSILAWRIPLTEEPSRLQSMGSQRVRQDLATEHAHEVPFPKVGKFKAKAVGIKVIL